MAARDGRQAGAAALAGSHKAARLAAVLLQQFHIGDGHAAIHGFAHIVNGQQGYLHRYINQQLTESKLKSVPNFLRVSGTGLGQDCCPGSMLSP